MEAEAPILRPPDAKSWLIGKDPDAGKDWGQEEKGETEDEMVGWHHLLNGHELEQAPGDSGQGSLTCCSPWCHEESDMTEWLNNMHIHVSILFQVFPDNSVGKGSACNAGDPSSIPGSGRCSGEGKGYPLQYSSLENSTDCTVHGVTKSWTQLSDFQFHFFQALF